MKFKVYDTQRLRYLTDEELEYGFYYTGEFDQTSELPDEYIMRFHVNLLTGKIKTEKDFVHNFGTDITIECSASGTYYADDDNFILSIGEEDGRRL